VVVVETAVLAAQAAAVLVELELQTELMEQLILAAAVVVLEITLLLVATAALVVQV
jgi:hypothetical protein